jgi:hypothetical protein
MQLLSHIVAMVVNGQSHKYFKFFIVHRGAIDITRAVEIVRRYPFEAARTIDE